MFFLKIIIKISKKNVWNVQKNTPLSILSCFFLKNCSNSLLYPLKPFHFKNSILCFCSIFLFDFSVVNDII